MTALPLAVVAALPAPGDETRPVDCDEIGALIDDIVTRFHETHRRELPELVRLARRVEAAHGDRSESPVGLSALLESMHGELTKHMAKEEIVVFPRMRRRRAAPLDRPLAALIAEHDAHGAEIARLRAMTNAFTAPSDACPTWRALYAGLAKFVDDLEEHIAIENGALFPRFAA